MLRPLLIALCLMLLPFAAVAADESPGVLVQPHATRFASRTVARMPCSCARNRAVASPEKPAPMMTTSASMSARTGPSSGGGGPAVSTQ